MKANWKTMLACLAMFGCGSEGRSGQLRPDTRYVRRIQLADDLVSRKLSCSDGVSRDAGKFNATPVLITFVSSGDCLSCGTHAPGLEAVRKSGAIKAEFFTVAYASSQEQPAVLRSLNAMSTNPVCFDAEGFFWRAHDLTRTPVTLLVVAGKIRMVHDKSLDSPEQRRSFIQAVNGRIASGLER